MDLHAIKPILFVCLSLVSGESFADSSLESKMPDKIEVSQIRSELTDKFPKIEPEGNRISALKRYRSALELFRVGPLESVNERIAEYCSDLEEYEKLVRKTLNMGDVAKNLASKLIDRALKEREKCVYENYNTSPFFKVYDDFLGIYKRRSIESYEELSSCYSNDTCRLSS